MVSQTVKIINEMGFHMRPAKDFVSAMTKFDSDIILNVHGKDINGKSVMNIMASCIKKGDTLTIKCEGADENQMLDEATAFIKNGMGEL